MPPLPRIVWIAVAAVGLLVLALCGATAYAMLREATRRRLATWPGARIVALLAAAAVPWLIVWRAPIALEVRIHGLGPLLGWLAVALLAFALLVLLPLAAVLGSIAWWAGRRRSRTEAI